MKIIKFVFLLLFFSLYWSCNKANDTQSVIDITVKIENGEGIDDGTTAIENGESSDDGTTEIESDESTDITFEFKWPEEWLDWPEEITWSVKLKLKVELDDNCILSEDPIIKALVIKHDVRLKQSFLNPRSTPELLLYYDITGKGCMSIESRENVIQDFLKTKKFEAEVYVYGIAYTC